MTIPYNSSVRSMKKYLADSLVLMDVGDDKLTDILIQRIILKH
jgi:hypothetical protein